MDITEIKQHRISDDERECITRLHHDISDAEIVTFKELSVSQVFAITTKLGENIRIVKSGNNIFCTFYNIDEPNKYQMKLGKNVLKIQYRDEDMNEINHAVKKINQKFEMINDIIPFIINYK